MEKKKNLIRKTINKLLNRPDRYIKEYLPDNSSFDKIAFLSYKFIASNPNHHSNNQEIDCIINILINSSYKVYLLDKKCKKIPKKYLKRNVNLFVGIDGAGSGKYYFNHLDSINAKRNILILTVHTPGLIRRRLEERKLHRKKDLNINMEYTRKVSLKDEEIFNRNISKVDLILSPDTSADPEAIEELKKLNIKTGTLNWTTIPSVKKIKRSKTNEIEFVAMCGGDALRKGLDYAIDVFSKMPFKLNILAPDIERINEILAIYKNPKNIKYHGYIDISSKKFNEIVKKSKFCVNFSAIEGVVATSQLHLMKTGLVPIIDKNAGVLDYKCGLIIDLYRQNSQEIRDSIIDYVSNISWQEYKEESLIASNFVIDKHNLKNYRQNIFKHLS